jgi:hypothetical protein
MSARVLGDGNQMVRGIKRAIAGMSDDAFIYLFTKGPAAAVKYFAVLGSSPTATEMRKSAVHVVAESGPRLRSDDGIILPETPGASVGSASWSPTKSNTLRSTFYYREDGFAHDGKPLLAARIESWSKDRSLSVLEGEKRMDEEDGLHPGPSSVIFRYWRGHRRLIGRREPKGIYRGSQGLPAAYHLRRMGGFDRVSVIGV